MSALGTAMRQQEAPSPERLSAFIRSTESLASLREQLAADITAIPRTRNRCLAKFDAEATNIQDPAITSKMTLLRLQTEQDQNERERNATEAPALLDSVLLKGSDLQHAANCIIIANNLHNNGTIVDTTVADAKTSANDY